MSQRIEKVQSLVQQTVAAMLPHLLEKKAAGVTVTGVDVTPDMRQGIVWVSVLDPRLEEPTLAAILAARRDFQRRLARVMTTKFVPRLSFKLDSGGQYADRINRLLHELD